MDCAEFERLIGSYLKYALNPRQQREFSTHLADCEECSAYLTSYRIVVTLLKEQPRMV